MAIWKTRSFSIFNFQLFSSCAQCAPYTVEDMDKYYLIGEHLGHSCSPEIHRAFGRYDYELRELAPAELEPFLRARRFAGLNVTLPYKEAVISYLDRLDEEAAAIGAVNTVVNREGVLWGYNTDFGGMKAALESLCHGWAVNGRPCGAGPIPRLSLRDRSADRSRQSVSEPLREKSILILGTGGSSKTALAVCRALGAARISRVSRSGREGALTYEALRQGEMQADLIINCTPVGMWPDLDGLPLDLSDVPNCSAVFDCVYNPLRTRLVVEARALGLPAAGGLEMLVRQAALACELFTDVPVEDEQLDSIFDSLQHERENLVLIGMPGAGKTTVGRILTQKTGRQFVDIDEEIEIRAGMTISAIFEARGEAGFRDLEAAVIRDFAGLTGGVVATGGGSVLQPENLRRLKQNGRLILLDRPLEALLPSSARPLGDTAEKLTALYAERIPIYTAAAELRIDNSGTPEEAADAVLAAL